MECLPKEGMFINRLLKDYIYMRTLQDNPEFAEAEHKRLTKAAEAKAEEVNHQTEGEGEVAEEEESENAREGEEEFYG